MTGPFFVAATVVKYDKVSAPQAGSSASSREQHHGKRQSGAGTTTTANDNHTTLGELLPTGVAVGDADAESGTDGAAGQRPHGF
jgi:hypothetical protein